MAHPSVSVALATSPSSPDDIALAEQLGYERAWLFDTPQQSPAGIRQAVSALADQGVTEIAYLPCGPDIRRELEVFIEAARHAVG